MTDTSLRYLAMLEFIPREPESVSVDEITHVLDRKGFSIDKRSIQRDLNKLATSFKLVSSQDGKSNRWSYSDDAPVRFFPSMDEHTALSFQLIQAFLKPMLAPESLDNLSPLFKKSAERLSKRAEAPARWREKIHIHPLGLARIPPRIDPDVQEQVYHALLWEKPLQIQYRARNAAKAKEYFVTPLGLVIRDYITYVVLTVMDDDSIRYFPLHRFKHAVCVDSEYRRPAGFNLTAYANENMGFRLSKSETVDLVMWMSKDAAVNVAECPVSKNQVMAAQEDGSFILTARVPNTHELLGWIYSYGPNAEVLKPEYLRVDIAEGLASMLKRYKAKNISK